MSLVIPTTITFSWSCANDKTTSQPVHETTCAQSCGAGGHSLAASMLAGNGTLTASITDPDGTTTLADPLDTFNSWEDGSGTGSWAADLRATFTQAFWDEEAGGTQTSGILTPRGRPNHIRQGHGAYVLTFDTDITASVSVELNYTHGLTLAEANAIYGEETGWEHVDEPVAKTATASASDTYAAAGETVYNPLDPTDGGGGLPMLDYSAGIGWNFYGVPVPIGTEFATLSGSLTHCTADLSVYDSVNATTATGLTVTARRGDYRGDQFTVGPDAHGHLQADAPEWDGGDCGLKGFPVYPGSTGAEAASGSTFEGRVRNSTGPGWVYSWDRPNPPEGWTVQVPYSFPLNEARGRDQAHWYGRFERLWARPAEDATWTPFTVGHVASLLVDDMTSSHPDQTVNHLSGGDGTYYAWTGSGLGTGGATGVSDGYRTATVASDAATPTLFRRLQSDWDDCEANPSAFRDDTDTPAAIADYIGKGHAGGDHVGGTGFWYNVRKRVRTGSDIYNWSNHRWLKVRGKGGGAWTLRIHADNVTVTDDYHLGELSTNPETLGTEGDRHISVARSGVTVDCGPFTFGATDTDVYIDLADAAARALSNLAHVTQVEFLLTAPGGGTSVYHFDFLTLCSGTATGTNAVNEGSTTFKVFCGVPYADDACIVPIADGRACCAQDDVEGLPPWVLSAVWRQVSVTPPDEQPRPVDETKTLEELAEEIGYQEGFTVSAVTAPPGDFTGWPYAIYIDCGESTGAVEATVKCREIRVPSLVEETWPAKETYGAALYGIATDPVTRWPVSGAAVDFDGSRGAGVFDDLDSRTTDANGAFRSAALPAAGRGKWQSALDDDDPMRQPLYTAHRLTAPALLTGGLPAQASHACPNRQATFYLLSGTPPGSTTARMVALAVSETGFMARAYETGASVRVQRRTRDGGTWQTIGEQAAGQPGLWWGLDGRVWAVVASGADVLLWDVEDDVSTTLATGSYPQGAINDSGSHLAVSYWRANRHRIRVYDGQGNDLYGEVTVQGSDVPEGPFAVAWRSDGTLEGQYSNGASVVQMTSNTGEVWA